MEAGPLASLSNQQLVARCARAGPEDPAWLEFFSRFSRRIRLIVYRAFAAEASRSRGLDVGPLAEAVEDLVQEVFARLLTGERRALARFRGKSENSIYTYLASISVNLVRDYFKKLRAQKVPPAAVSLEQSVAADGGRSGGLPLGALLASSDPDPEQLAETRELRRRIAAAVEEAARGPTSRRDRLVFRLFFIEERTVEEIASCKAVGLSPSGVEKCIRRLRTSVQRSLVGGAGGGGPSPEKSSPEGERV